MFVTDLTSNWQAYSLPKRFVDCLPEFCETCGAPMEIGESLTGLHCSNPRCSDKMVMRIKSLCQDLGVLSFGESTIEKFIDMYHPKSPMEIFRLRRGMQAGTGVGDGVSMALAEQLESKNKMLLWEYVMMCNVPGVRTSARKIFQGYKTLDEVFDRIESEGGLGFIQGKLGLTGDPENGGMSIQALKIFNNLREYKEELLYGVQFVEVIDLKGVKELNVVCSDQVGNGFNKKSEFYAYVNCTFGDKVHVNFLPAVNRGIDYLVWAGADGTPARYTSKVKTVEGYNAKGSNIPIVTASQFIEIMQKL